MTGEKTAVAAAIAASQIEDGDDVEQLDLLGMPPDRRNVGDDGVISPEGENRGPGRPKGSRNRRTTQMVDFLMRQYADPRAVLLQIAQTPIAELMSRLSCTALEALQEKRLAAIGVLPYVAQKQPLAVNLNSRQVIHLTIEEGGFRATDNSAAALLELDLSQVEQNQQLSNPSDDEV